MPDLNHTKKTSDFTGLSLIIPFHADPELIKKCLDAIDAAALQLPAEHRKKIEILLIDDASPRKLAYENPRLNILYIRLAKNRGAGFARNIGAQKAAYSHLCFIDSDIIIDKTFLAAAFDRLQNQNIKVLQGRLSDIPANAHPSSFQRYLALSWHYFFLALWWYGGWTLCTIMDREFFIRTGGFCEHYPGSGGEEFEFAAKLWQIDPTAVTLSDHLGFRHHYDQLWPRLKKVMIRSARLQSTLKHHDGLPPSFKRQSALRVVFALTLTLLLLTVFLHPTWALIAYFITGIVFFLADGALSTHFLKNHSWKLALVSVVFRQLEYLAVFSGIIWGVLKKTDAS